MCKNVWVTLKVKTTIFQQRVRLIDRIPQLECEEYWNRYLYCTFSTRMLHLSQLFKSTRPRRVVQNNWVDNTIHWINLYLVHNSVGFPCAIQRFISRGQISGFYQAM